jgi:hypothetical protein
MRNFRQILPIMIAMITLSGCVNRKIKAMPIMYSNTNTNTNTEAELLKPFKHSSSSLKASTTNSSKYAPHGDIAYLAKNQRKLDQDKSLELVISEYGYTRISIEDERITDVFIFPQEAAGVKIHEQGYLIIAPTLVVINLDEEAQETHHKTQLTITGEHGTTQDFSLRLTGKAPEPVKFVKSNLEQINLTHGD